MTPARAQRVDGPHRSMVGALGLLVAASISGCAGPPIPAASAPSSVPHPTTTSTPPAASLGLPSLDGSFTVHGEPMRITCYGDKDPTVVVQPGGTDIIGTVNIPVRILQNIGTRARACAYTRQDLAAPPDQPPTHTMAQHVADLRDLMAQAHLTGKVIWAGTSMGGNFALASALGDPQRSAGLLIIDTDYPDPDTNRICRFAGLPSCRYSPAYLKSDALAIGLGKELGAMIHPLPGVAVRVITSDAFGPGCYFFWTSCDEKKVNKKIVEFQKVGWGQLSKDFQQTIVHVGHDSILDGAHDQIVAGVDSILATGNNQR